MESPSVQNNKLELINKEDYWIKTLGTAYPFGLNDRVKGFEDMQKINLATLNRCYTPFHNPQSGIHRRRRSHGHRKTRKLRQFWNTSSKDLIISLLELFTKSRHSLFVALKGLSLKDVMRINKFLGFHINDSKLSIPNDFCEMVIAYTTTKTT